MPTMVAEAKPPRAFVSSHSRPSAAARSPHVSGPNSIIASPFERSGFGVQGSAGTALGVGNGPNRRDAACPSVAREDAERTREGLGLCSCSGSAVRILLLLLLLLLLPF